ncbi:MAG: efflux RND transporter permease subunit, partial [Chloroflexi bacterium]|nr:efflux RND transporter permease subunit [Chloroflexota bacterium]
AIGVGKGSETNEPMATAVIGGLLTSTFLTLFVVPVVYTLFDDLSLYFQRRKQHHKTIALRPVDAVHPNGTNGAHTTRVTAPGQNGASYNGTGQNGTSQNGTSQNGIGQNGASRNGLGQNGIGQNGTGHGETGNAGSRDGQQSDPDPGGRPPSGSRDGDAESRT